MYADLGNLKGYYKHPRGRKVIAINFLLSKFAQTIVIAHELGHAILHSSSTVALMHKHILYTAAQWKIKQINSQQNYY